jgi:7-cyano-7-deazaguanine synthase
MTDASENKPRAVVLLSGGLDSYTAAAVIKAEGRDLFALTINYGQRHQRELEAARSVASALGVVRQAQLEIDLAQFGGSSLTGASEITKGRPLDATDIPSTYVPARNTVFLALALGWAEVLEASEIVIGVNSVDYSGYPDCRPEFIEAFQHLASLATRAGVQGKTIRVRTPLLTLSKAEIITLGASLGVDYALTHSCYDPRLDGSPCRQCDSCRLREEGFRAAGIADPLVLRCASPPTG